LLSSGIGKLFTDQVAASTYEGTSTILHKEAARYLLKQMELIDKGQPAKGVASYLNDLKQLKNLKSKAKTTTELTDLSVLYEALAARAAINCFETNELMKTPGLTQKQKMNEHFSIEAIQMVRSHI